MKRFLTFILILGILCFCWVKVTHLNELSMEAASEKTLSSLSNDKEVYAYLHVEDTNIDYPVAQHPTDDSYYLSHDIDHNESIYGAIFTERVNAKDFNDLATIIYGHATQDGTMFGTLSYFADPEFFNKNKRVTVQTQQEKISYEVFAAYSFTDEHIYHTFHLENKNAVNAYFGQIKEFSVELGGNYREIKRKPTDRLLILSTCDAEDGGRRFVVHAIERERRPV
ncbi:class B sortase [Candidatus Enterococcus ferrettii]|uniref:Sortase B n=1 Tax=Candidatus Enterococcus ferrettii TaxID=2815324 RepID=A0ABV0EL79_9ENTE|nr:class B sortase [Enterococcus sp. 665A]MBO1342558.1 class B sortase [Enterococcus sp. 665A]